nr:MAG TPA: hypothetical protein [Bacteriophage sp.]
MYQFIILFRNFSLKKGSEIFTVFFSCKKFELYMYSNSEI